MVAKREIVGKRLLLMKLRLIDLPGTIQFTTDVNSTERLALGSFLGNGASFKLCFARR